MKTTRYYIETFGCQMNVHDSQRMEDSLQASGWQCTSKAEDADLIVFNTCSIREKAEHKLRSEMGRLRPLKTANPDLVIAIAGCVAQQEGEALLRDIPHVDILVGPDNLAELPMLTETIRLGGPPVARTVFDLESPMFLTAATGFMSGRTAPISAFVTTMKGCDERCSFCVVPYTRGPERYRSMQEIIQEIQALIANGAREITLLGQTVNSWSPPETYSLDDERSLRHRESQFPELLYQISKQVPALQRLRYTSPHPRHLTPALIQAHAELSALAKHVHLPVQSGSDRLLKRMIRRYTRHEFIERANALKTQCPGLTLSTDVIVGFPGETDQDFEQTLSLIREVGFVALFGFKFSPRPHTPALKLADDVPESVKSERLAELFNVMEHQQQVHLTSLVGSTASVLIEGESRPNQKNIPTQTSSITRIMGRTERNEIVHIEVPQGRDGTSLLGTFVPVTLSQANAHSLMGTLRDEESCKLPFLKEVNKPLQTQRRLQILSP